MPGQLRDERRGQPVERAVPGDGDGGGLHPGVQCGDVLGRRPGEQAARPCQLGRRVVALGEFGQQTGDRRVLGGQPPRVVQRAQPVEGSGGIHCCAHGSFASLPGRAGRPEAAPGA
ncbi:hypothetical protein [Streptomyces sp. C8S0]|uniref:hypothetical protein n=1 Tax=Streptomyces sp. C8S0 TaxID=2585716 RepID=UPI00299F642E|nr:hypothetical protein [Streptomyces sp. C8S0]